MEQHSKGEIDVLVVGAGPVGLALGCKLARLVQDDDGVTAQLAGPGGGEQVRARWLVGTDGAHSTVRHLLGLPFEGATYEERIIQADLRIDWALAHEDDEVIAFLADDG